MTGKKEGKENILYLECSSGISGDMTVAALLDLGADEEFVMDQLARLPLHDFQIRHRRINKQGIDCRSFLVEVREGRQPHRHFADIRDMILASSMNEEVQRLAVHIFHILAEAEGKVHGQPADHVHFHEVGAIDSIVDIVAAAACIVDLRVKETVIVSMAEGQGSVLCQHGEMKVPVPAVAELAASWGLPLRITENKGEMITPTGAAIAAALRSRNKLPEQMEILAMGLGGGSKEFDQPNLLRAFLIRERRSQEHIWVLEANMDDCSGEQMAYLLECLLKKKVLDALYRPVYMKKNRPAYQLQVLCHGDQLDIVEDLIFRESTTIGIRRYPADRKIMEREVKVIESPFGPVRVKVCKEGDIVRLDPEYEDMRKLAREAGISYKEIRAAAIRTLEKQREPEKA